METLVLKQASERQERSALKSFGSVAKVFGKNATINPINYDRALIQQVVALQVEIIAENGNWEKLTCSKNVMKDLWSKEFAYSDLKTLDVIETFADKTVRNEDTGLYEKVLDENGNPVKERVLTLGYGGTDASALKLTITDEDLAKAETAKRSVNWESLIAL